MGVIMSFTRVSAADLERVSAVTEVLDEFLAELETPKGEPSGYLDKAWAGLEYLLAEARTGVDLFYTGNPLARDTYFAWSPDDVADASQRLNKYPFDALVPFFDPAAMDAARIYPGIWVRDSGDGARYLRHHYDGLVEVFRYAAERGSGFIQHFG
ncbi:YfbM family protein [Nocardia rhizosphaerae]|uniref:YfbM family protein n=1 Tax=Nocardia rhizosphaerae TaxID=1691571 RepID=A0ABV8L0S6_9NOCA